jgi:YD repeat-containing protein
MHDIPRNFGEIPYGAIAPVSNIPDIPDLSGLPDIMPVHLSESVDPIPLVASDNRGVQGSEGSTEVVSIVEEMPANYIELHAELPGAGRVKHEVSKADYLPPPNPKIEEQIRHAIDAKGGKITFAEFMGISLYGEGGYYAASDTLAGEGDFVTAPEMHPAFSAAIANNLHGIWEEMGSPSRFDVIEVGGGNGTMTRSILEKSEEWPLLYATVNSVICDYSPGLVAKQRETAGDQPVQHVNATAEALPFREVEGVFLFNELADVMPVHRLIGRDGATKEIYVTYDQHGRLTEVEDTISAAVDDPFYTDRVREGVEVTASPAMKRWQEGMANALEKGYVITIDYAVTNPEGNPYAYQPRVFSNGLRQTNDAKLPLGDVGYAYLRPGTVDITASVDFDQLRAMGEQAGLRTVSESSQLDYLLKHGFGEEHRKVWKREVTDKGLTFLDDRAIGLAGARALLAEDSATFRNFRVLVQSKGI